MTSPRRTIAAALFCVAFVIVGVRALRDGHPPAVEGQPPTDASFPLDSLEPSVRQQFADAIDLANRDPNDAEAAGHLAMLYHNYEIHRPAENFYRRAVELDPSAMKWHYYLGRVLMTLGETDAAAGEFDRVLADLPDDVPALLMRAEADLASNNFKDALRRYERAIAISPGDPHAHYGAGRSLLRLRRLDEALVRLNRAVEIAPRFGSARYVLAQTLRHLGRTDEATIHARSAELDRDSEPAADDPWMAEVDALTTGAIEPLHRGINLLQRGHPDEAIPLLEQAIRLNPQLAEAYSSMGTAWLTLNELDRASEYLLKAVELEPAFVQARYNLGLIAHRRNHFEEAVQHFLGVLKVRDDHFESHLALGTDLPRLGMRDEAIDHLRKANALDRDHPRPYKRLSAALVRRGDYEEAIQVLRRGSERLPRDASILDRLAWTQATCPDDRFRDAEQAVQLAREACQRTDNQVPKTLDTLAAALASAGRFDEAVSVATQAIAGARSENDVQLLTAMSKRRDLYAQRQAFYATAPSKIKPN